MIINLIIYFVIKRSFRLKTKRRFGQLLVRDQGGCTKHNPGIGDIAYVKDLQTGKVVNSKFRCSLFGGHSSPAIGWVSVFKVKNCWNNSKLIHKRGIACFSLFYLK